MCGGRTPFAYRGHFAREFSSSLLFDLFLSRVGAVVVSRVGRPIVRISILSTKLGLCLLKQPAPAEYTAFAVK